MTAQHWLSRSGTRMCMLRSRFDATTSCLMQPHTLAQTDQGLCFRHLACCRLLWNGRLRMMASLQRFWWGTELRTLMLGPLWPSW